MLYESSAPIRIAPAQFPAIVDLLVNFAGQSLSPGGIEDSLQGPVDLGRDTRLHLVDCVLLSIDNGLPLIHFILFGVHGTLPAVDLRLDLISGGTVPRFPGSPDFVAGSLRPARHSHPPGGC